MSAAQPRSEHELFVEKALAVQAQDLQQSRDLLKAILNELQSINSAIVNLA